MPGFLTPLQALAETKGKRLIVIQLTGGNDALNAFIPYTNDLYYANRPTIGLKKENVLRLNDEMGLNAALQPLKPLYDNGEMALISNVGYPNPDLSHFRSMDIWQTASDAKDYLNTGWLGRWVETQHKMPYHALEIDDSLSLAMKGNRLKAAALKNPDRFFNSTQSPFFKSLIAAEKTANDTASNLDYLYQTMFAANQSAAYIYEKWNLKSSKTEYPKSPFANDLKTIGRMIQNGLETQVYYVSQGGYDTHVRQIGQHEANLKQYSEAVAALVNDLKKSGNFNDTIIMTFSEFGRRVKQNASNGTDHGAASTVTLIGGGLKQKGFVNGLPDLVNLSANGDMQYGVDFRSIYTTLISRWLGGDAAKVLGQNFTIQNWI